MELFAVEVKEPSGDMRLLEAALLSRVSDTKRERLLRLKRKDDLWRSLAADLLLRLQLCRRLGVPNRELRFAFNDFGKPRMDGSPLEFNISHSGRWAVCALDTSPIGIDIEQVKPIDLHIAKRFFAPEEWERLEQIPPELRLDRFFELWTLKESCIKQVGMGLSIPLNEVVFRLDGEAILFESRHSGDACRFGDCRFRLYPFDAAYKLAVCARTDRFPGEVTVIGLEQLVMEVLEGSGR